MSNSIESSVRTKLMELKSILCITINPKEKDKLKKQIQELETKIENKDSIYQI